MDTVNVFAPELRGKVKKEVDFAPGAWVEFYDDLTIGAITVAEQEIGKGNTDADLQLILDQVADWNFADKDGKKLDITLENFKRLSTKFLQWMGKIQKEILVNPETEDKKKESASN